ncbi:MAG TPA: hypothetical protein PL158_12260 [Bacillota bacterium]|nr:hypothetical protein [Bacillota bacterium]
MFEQQRYLILLVLIVGYLVVKLYQKYFKKVEPYEKELEKLYKSIADEDQLVEELQKLINQYPNAKKLYQELTGLYLKKSRFTDVKNLFDSFREKNGVELEFPEFALSDVESLIAERETLENSREKTFCRIPNSQRLGISNFTIWQPVETIVIAEEWLELTDKDGSHRYFWNDFENVTLKTASGRNKWFGKYIAKLLVLKVGDKEYKLDVTEVNSDYAHADILFKELERHLKITA